VASQISHSSPPESRRAGLRERWYRLAIAAQRAGVITVGVLFLLLDEYLL